MARGRRFPVLALCSILAALIAAPAAASNHEPPRPRVVVTAPAVGAQLVAGEPVPLAGDLPFDETTPLVQRVALSVRDRDTGAYHDAQGEPSPAFRAFNAPMTTNRDRRPTGFATSIPLGPGAYTLRVRAVGVGVDAVVYRAFRVLAAPDAEPPTLELTSPATGAGAVVDGALVATVLAADDVEGPALRVTLTVRDPSTGQYWSAPDGGFVDAYTPHVQHVTASTSPVPVNFEVDLPPGGYTLTVVARDAAGRPSTRVGGRFTVVG